MCNVRKSFLLVLLVCLPPRLYDSLVALALVMVALLAEGLEVLLIIEVLAYRPGNDMVHHGSRRDPSLTLALGTQRMRRAVCAGKPGPPV